MWPLFITATVSAMVMASSWSWVTWMKVSPTSVWMRLSSTCISRRSLRSSAPSGSSSSSTSGWLTRARASATRCCWPPESWAGLRAANGRHLHQLQRLLGPLGRVGDLAALGPEGDVVVDRQVREQRVGLEHRVDRALVGPRPGEVGVTDHHPPGRGLLEAGDHPERGRLAAARRAQQREERPSWDLQVDVVDRGEVAEPLGDALELEVALRLAKSGHVSSPSPSWTTGRRTGCPRPRRAPGTAGRCCPR